MKIKHTGLALAIASTCGLWMPMAQALPVSLAQEEPTESGANVWSFNQDLVLEVPTIANYTVNTNNLLFIKLTLQGGAKFGVSTDNITLLCDTAGTPGVRYDNINASRTNEASAAITFQVPTNNSPETKMGGTCVLAFKNINVSTAGNSNVPLSFATFTAGLVVSGVGPILKLGTQTTQSLKVINEYQDGIQARVDETAISLISFKPSVKFNVGIQEASNNTFANATISVADGSSLFTAGTLASNQAAFIGYAVATTAGNHTRFRATATTAVLSNMISDITFDIGGTPVEFANNIGWIESANAANCNSLLNQTIAPSDGIASLTTNSLNIFEDVGVTFCMGIDGVQQQQEGQITLTLSGTPLSSNGVEYAIDFGGPYDLYNLPKDGASYRALLIPPSDQAERAFIRITNTSTTAGEIIGTLYDTTGVVGSAAQVLGTVQPRQTFVLAATDLEAVFGTWSGRARLVIDSRIPELRVLSVLRSRSGILVNMSGEAEN